MTNDDEQATILVDKDQREWEMLTVAEITVQVMVSIVQTVSVGTNIGLIRILWVMINGSFLQSRGAVFSALHLNGIEAQEVRRSWAALRDGKWQVIELLENLPLYVASESQTRARPKSVVVARQL